MSTSPTQHQLQATNILTKLILTLAPRLQIRIEPLKPRLCRLPKPRPLRNQNRKDARKLLRLHKGRPARRLLARLKAELMISGKEARDAPKHASPAELAGRVLEDGGRDGHALEDVVELRAGGGGRVGGGYGLDEAGGPGGVGGEAEELVLGVC
jgi:hypothetical protein